MGQLRCRELEHVEELVSRHPDRVRHKILGTVSYLDQKFSIPQISMGNPESPTLIMAAGVHGLERIGSEVVLAYLQTCLQRLKWDDSFCQLLDQTQLVFIPVVNPVGIARRTRSNGQGVDLMRNAPIHAEERGGFIHRGQQLSSKLPFFRGNPESMEQETRILCESVRAVNETATRVLAMDVHSGFGAVDRLWFPFSHSQKPFPNLGEAFKLKRLLDSTYPNHFYAVEPMAKQYTIHGDLWDYLYIESRQRNSTKLFIPWTLEMGSWVWMKKNPLQAFSVNGFFDPIRPHRRQRILRRHLTLFDFVHRSLVSRDPWWNLDHVERAQLDQTAHELWYSGRA